MSAIVSLGTLGATGFLVGYAARALRTVYSPFPMSVGESHH